MNRVPPHDFGMASAAMRLPYLPEDIDANTQRFLSGRLDDNLAVIFNTLSLHTLELACLKFFYTDAPFEEALDLLGQSAQAQANKFRLLGDGRSKQIPISWAGVTREIPVQRPIDMHNTLGIGAALINAKLAGRSEDLAFLTGIPWKDMVHPAIRQHEATLRFTAFLQGLFRGVRLGDDLDEFEQQSHRPYSDDNLRKSGINADTDANVAYIRAYVKAYIALGKRLQGGSDEGRLPGLIGDLLAVHKALFDSEKDDMRWVVPGLLCFHALGICALAKTAGLDLAVDNPYVPQLLISRVN